MLTKTKDIYGNRLAALDGDIGEVEDFYFDDRNWVIRYLVADTGEWLPGRLVLLSPQAFGKLDQYDNTLHLKLTKQKIADSPELDPRQPVSRRDEAAYYRYFGWPAYWEGSALWGRHDLPVSSSPPWKGEQASVQKHHHREEKHLQSAQEVVNCHIQTTDGTIGHVTGFLVDDRSWIIHQLVVETGDWYAGREILIEPTQVERISFPLSKVFVRLTKADILRNEERHLSPAGSNQRSA